MKAKFLLVGFVFALLCSCEKDKDKVSVITEPITDIYYNTETGLTEVGIEGTIVGDASKVTKKGFIMSKANKFDQEIYAPEMETDHSFYISFNNLSKDVVYYIKAYALTASGTVYGEELRFTASTLPLVEDHTDYDAAKTATTVLISGQVLSDGGNTVTSYGAYIAAAGQEARKIAGANKDADGNFTVDVRSLDENTEYFVTLFAANGRGEKTLEATSFTTVALTTPAVALDASEPFPAVTATTMTVKAKVSDFGGDPDAEYGVKYGLSATDLTAVKGTNIDENGVFTLMLNPLTPDMDYYIAAYVKTPKEEVVTTPVVQKTEAIGPPSVETTELVAGSDYTDNTITLKGKLISDGGKTITKYGFYWGTSAGATTEVLSTDLNKNGVFSVTLDTEDGITPMTKYYFRAFAYSDESSQNDDEKSITTGVVDKLTYLWDQNGNTTTTRLVYFLLDPVSVTISESPVELVFLDRNLGATKRASSVDWDKNAVGYYYKWGVPTPEVTPAMVGANKNLTAAGMQTSQVNNQEAWDEDPCPEGFHVTTREEYAAAFSALGIADVNSLYNKLFVPISGDFQKTTSGSAMASTAAAHLWSGTGDMVKQESGNYTYAYFVNSGVEGNIKRLRSKPVRCVKDY